MENHPNVLAHFINIDIWTINIDSFIPNFTRYTRNIDGIIHPVQTTKVG